MIRFFLKTHKLGSHIVEKLKRKSVSRFCRNVFLIVREITDHLIDTVDANGREVIAQRSQIALGVWEKTAVNMTLNFFSLNLKTCFG